MNKKINNIVSVETIESKILHIRGQKVITDRDLANFYGVETKVLNQAVKRNMDRFPADFMFQLNKIETDVLVTNCDRFRTLKHSSSLPYAFTEQGVAMLSSVLKSKRAIGVNIAIMRIFVNIRKFISSYDGLARKIAELESKYDIKISEIMNIIDYLVKDKEIEKDKKEIGFKTS